MITEEKIQEAQDLINDYFPHVKIILSRFDVFEIDKSLSNILCVYVKFHPKDREIMSLMMVSIEMIFDSDLMVHEINYRILKLMERGGF